MEIELQNLKILPNYLHPVFKPQPHITELRLRTPNGHYFFLARSVACPLRKQQILAFGTFFRGNVFSLPLIQGEQVNWRKNGHLILINCLREACPGTVWLSN